MDKRWMSMLAALLLAPIWTTPAVAGGKQLPSAFGKELVPDETTQQSNEPKAAEIEELKDKEEEEERQLHRPHHAVGGHGRIHIQLDGDEDGGGDDDLDSDY
jgi:hypothetical protein